MPNNIINGLNSSPTCVRISYSTYSALNTSLIDISSTSKTKCKLYLHLFTPMYAVFYVGLSINCSQVNLIWDLVRINIQFYFAVPLRVD